MKEKMIETFKLRYRKTTNWNEIYENDTQNNKRM